MAAAKTRPLLHFNIDHKLASKEFLNDKGIVKTLPSNQFYIFINITLAQYGSR